MKWIEIMVWDDKSQSFFPSWELVSKSEEELKSEAFTDKVCLCFWFIIGISIAVVAIIAIVTIAH